MAKQAMRIDTPYGFTYKLEFQVAPAGVIATAPAFTPDLIGAAVRVVGHTEDGDQVDVTGIATLHNGLLHVGYVYYQEGEAKPMVKRFSVTDFLDDQRLFLIVATQYEVVPPFADKIGRSE